MGWERIDRPDGSWEKANRVGLFFCGEEDICCGDEHYTCGGEYISMRSSKVLGVWERQDVPT